ncbi:MAG: glycosyltransferase WbpL [Fimbriimonadaceae bacterium]|jgi:Fuc2NAc and GlcNAc transferase|nr:glycosyltransferase WbpL [Fimbriimonadaceae bacterium]
MREPITATILFVWLLSFALSAVLVGVVRSRALKGALLDMPNERSLHTAPTPRGGGLGIVAAFYASTLCLPLLSDQRHLMGPLLLGGIPIAVVGWKDDHGHVPPKWRALVHILSGLLAFGAILFWNLAVDITLLDIAWLICATIAGAYFLNIFNFMDGIDGLAGSEGAFAALAGGALMTRFAVPRPYEDFADSYFFHARGLAPFCITLGLCCAGFLVWNWPPARIFMGDVGSGFIGFALAFFALCETREDASSLWMWLILLGAFVVDGTYTLFTRFRTKQKWYEAHRLHAFQKATLRAGNHRTVTLAVLAINVVWLLPLAAIAAKRPDLGLWITLIAYAPLVLLVRSYRAGQLESTPVAQ